MRVHASAHGAPPQMAVPSWMVHVLSWAEANTSHGREGLSSGYSAAWAGPREWLCPPVWRRAPSGLTGLWFDPRDRQMRISSLPGGALLVWEFPTQPSADADAAMPHRAPAAAAAARSADVLQPTLVGQGRFTAEGCAQITFSNGTAADAALSADGAHLEWRGGAAWRRRPHGLCGVWHDMKNATFRVAIGDAGMAAITDVRGKQATPAPLRRRQIAPRVLRICIALNLLSHPPAPYVLLCTPHSRAPTPRPTRATFVCAHPCLWGRGPGRPP